MNLLHTLSDIALRHMPEKWFLGLRTKYYTLRRKLAPILCLKYGTFDTTSLRKHLEQRLGSDFEILMVHSSVNHMLPYYKGNPLELVRMLIDFCGPNRTLVMPAFYFGDPKIGTVHETFKACPIFDLKKTPSQMGLATELFRRSRGVIQSRHPVYRVSALGPLAKELVQGHENATGPAGFGSPFEYMAARNTLVIGIGKSFHVMTQVHHVDEIMGDTFPVPRNTKNTNQSPTPSVTVVDGEEKIPVNLKGGGIQWRYNVAKLPSLLKEGELECWKFHNVPLFAANAQNVTKSLIEAAKKGKTLYDPN